MIRKIFASFFLSIIFISSFSQRKYSREEYIQAYRTLAVHEMQRTGIPASIKLAQACLESADGNSELSRKSNNHFGIKCKSDWTGKRVYHDDDMRNECFRSYKTVEESFVDHSNFLSANPRYSALFNLEITDYKGWAHGLKKAGYATNPHYAERLIRIIEEYKLYIYDQVIDGRQLARINNNNGSNGTNGGGPLINPYESRKIVSRNGLKSIVVKNGDSISKIAEELNMKTWEIFQYNDFPKNRRLYENEILYIEPKRNKAHKNNNVHVFEHDDSMHFISQRYGIKLKNLYRMNRMSPNTEPREGTVIYLRNKKPQN
ncbi:glucosaminidase domain-containing protein [Gaoshiqia sp. Z1-71]|uniref:glucosaminidase domain-containing protein n=1 Tax=Gaoshiqia hydrogeniformans TaxID=3290090 RepID=UPI003BF7BEC7